MSNYAKDVIVNLFTNWMEEVGCEDFTSRVDEKGMYVDTPQGKVRVPETLSELLKTL